MPQMTPLWWETLYLWFTLSFMITLKYSYMLIHYMFLTTVLMQLKELMKSPTTKLKMMIGSILNIWPCNLEPY